MTKFVDSNGDPFVLDAVYKLNESKSSSIYEVVQFINGRVIRNCFCILYFKVDSEDTNIKCLSGSRDFFRKSLTRMSQKEVKEEVEVQKRKLSFLESLALREPKYMIPNINFNINPNPLLKPEKNY